jgi:hypothetical protein
MENSMIMDSRPVPISDVPIAIREVYKDKSPSYRQLYAAVLDGSIPAERIKGRWHVAGLMPVIEHFRLGDKV